MLITKVFSAVFAHHPGRAVEDGFFPALRVALSLHSEKFCFSFVLLGHIVKKEKDGLRRRKLCLSSEKNCLRQLCCTALMQLQIEEKNDRKPAQMHHALTCRVCTYIRT